jgi:hypothetical protein
MDHCGGKSELLNIWWCNTSILNFNSLWNSLWDTWKCPCITLSKVGSVMDQYDWISQFLDIFFKSLPYQIFRKHIHRRRDSDWLRAGRRRGRSSNPGRVKNFLFSTSSKLASYPRGMGGALSLGVKRRCQENVDLYIHSHICLHGVVLN